LFKEFLKALLKVVLAGPSLIGVCIGLSTAAKESGFSKSSPEDYANLLSLIKILLRVVIDNAVGYIAFCAILAFLWVLIVTEPKVKSKRRFDERRRKRLGDKR
jgi:hypothetical protein